MAIFIILLLKINTYYKRSEYLCLSIVQIVVVRVFGFSLGQRLEMESLNPGIKPVSPVYGTTVLRPYGNSSAFSLI